LRFAGYNDAFHRLGSVCLPTPPCKALDDLVYMKDIDRGLGGRILRKGKKREDERPLSLQRWLKGSPGGDEEE
jgi:hypothetical protein